jgi:hypothetical protein
MDPITYVSYFYQKFNNLCAILMDTFYYLSNVHSLNANAYPCFHTRYQIKAEVNDRSLI